MASKPSIYSWELWLTIAGELYCFLNLIGVFNEVRHMVALFSWAIIQGCFSLSRGMAKSSGSFDPSNKNNYTLFPTYKNMNRR
jgi:predicted GNAT superfamily acetyltransferase